MYIAHTIKRCKCNTLLEILYIRRGWRWPKWGQFLFVQLAIDWISVAVKIWQHFDNSVFEYVYISEIWQAIRSRDEWWPRIVILQAFDCWSQNCQLWISFCIFQDFLAFSLINANGHLKRHQLKYGLALVEGGWGHFWQRTGPLV